MGDDAANGGVSWLKLVGSVAGGLAIFLYGLERISTGLRKGAGDSLRTVLRRMCRNTVTGLGTGAIVTAILSSSTAASVMLVTFVEAGYITFEQSLGAMLGVNIGTTLTVQLVAFDLAKYALLLVAVGYFARPLVAKRHAYIPPVVFGLGLLFFSVEILQQALAPLRGQPAIWKFLASMSRPIVGVAAGTVFTVIVQSSAAVLGMALVLARQGALTQAAAVSLVLGANIGTTGTAVIASLGKQRDSARAALAYVVFKAAGVVAVVPFLDAFIWLVNWCRGTGSVPYPTTQAQRAEFVPGIIAASHTVFNLLIALVFLPFTGLVAHIVCRILPEKPTAAPATADEEYGGYNDKVR